MRNEISGESIAMKSAIARKRRRRLRAVQRGSQGSDEDSVAECLITPKLEEDDDDYLPSSSSQSLLGVKKQARYEPGVPMSREQLTAWRKEARRVRNRESAAASRKRTRERIEELESEVSVWQSKYSVALKRIEELEAAALKAKNAFTPLVLSQVSSPSSPVTVVSPSPSAMSSPELSSFVPFFEPNEGFCLNDTDDIHKQEVQKRYQHIIEMISRPEAKGMIS